MLHKIPTSHIGPNGETMARAVEACVHCGFCLATCPTYVALGEEMDSPRGRIFLMKEVLEGSLPAREAALYVDRCLGCVACVTSCPSGVEYGHLLTAYRSWSENAVNRGLLQRLRRKVLLKILPYPRRLRLATAAGRLARPFRGLAPKPLRSMLELLPARAPAGQSLPERVPAEGKRRARVALLTGCAQQALAPELLQATLRVLSRNGVEVVLPRGQGCCGALAMHVGARAEALASARRNLKAFPDDIDAILVNAAGCGSGMKEYPYLFQGEPDRPEAEALASGVQDISVFLDQLGVLPPRGLKAPLRVAYHDACHLAHAQAVREPPRRLLKAIPNLTLLEPAEPELCCGSAGIYNLEHPATAEQLGERKARHLLATGAEAIASANIGCTVQLAHHLARLGRPLPVRHPVELLDQAYRE